MRRFDRSGWAAGPTEAARPAVAPHRFLVTTHFDAKAATWDEQPHRVALGAAIAAAVAPYLPVAPRPRLLDYGCGTGLCSLPLADQCASVLGMDSSAGMLAQFAAKARAAGWAYVTTRQHDLTVAPLPGLEFDVVLSAMTLHHVREVPLLLARLQALLVPGGLLALADLDAEDGTFHSDSTGVAHHGFARAWLAAQLQQTGFGPVRFMTVYVLEKPDATGALRRYPVFLATTHRPADWP